MLLLDAGIWNTQPCQQLNGTEPCTSGFHLTSPSPPPPPRAASLFWGPLHSNGVLRPDAGCHLLAKSSLWWFLFLFPGGCSHRRTNLGCSLLCVVLTPTASSKTFSLTVTCLQFCFQIRSQLYHYLSCSQIFCPYYWTIIYPLKENHSKRTLLCST